MAWSRNLIALQTLTRREVVRVIRIWSQTILPPIINMALYFVIFGNLIGSRIGTMHDIPYIDYIVPGLVMMAVIVNSYANVVSSFFGSKFQRNIEELLIAPIPNFIILWGFVAGGVIRGLAVGFCVMGVACGFTEISFDHPFFMLIVAFLTTTLFSLAGILNGLYAKKFDDISLIPTFVLTPLIYLGGVFYSIDLLPSFWQTATHFNPIFYMVNGFRYGMIGLSDVSMVEAIGVLLIFNLFFYMLSLALLRRGIGIRN